MAYVTKYGCRFDASRDPLEWEFDCIRQGGRWKHPKTGEDCGDGLFNHLMTARKLIWPHRYRHRWTDLMYENFINNDLTVLVGCASSQKTSHAVEFSLLNYWARPDNTLIILSTVNMDKLDIGIWAELQMLWSQGRQRYDWLPGSVVAYKRAITTDVLEEDGMRDFRRGCICRPCYVGGRWVGLGVLAGLKQDHIVYVADECFPADTLVDTTSGPKTIDFIVPGDEVISAIGPRRVEKVGSRWTDELVRITTSDGRRIECTSEHPFFTQFGWEKACNLGEHHYMMSADETMRILREPVHSEKSNSQILQSILRLEMGSQPTRNEGVLFGCSEEGARKESRLAEKTIGENEVVQSDAQFRELCESGCWHSSIGSLSKDPWREWYGSKQSGVATFTDVSRRGLEFSSDNWDAPGKWLSNVLQGGFGIPFYQTGHRSGRRMPQQSSKESQRSKENGISRRGSWVESVEVLKQDDPRFQNAGSNSGRCRVYNLQVEGHPSYSVNGLIAHNCQFMNEGFSGSWPHLFSNGNVKIIASGNPKHDPDDELGKAAEPVEGWNAHPEPEKTEVWPTKFMGGKCVNLVGTDSPNFDVPEGQPEPFPRLIGRKFAKRIAHDHGEGSFEFYRLVKGVMKVAFAGSRVITRQMCREHHALESVRWKDDKQVHLYALDPSYGGEDRCVGMPLKFGEDVDGNQILLVMPYRVYKLDLRKEKEVEDQIADIFSEELTLYDVPPENAFYDSCGKGTIGAAFARKFGFRVPVAVDSGMQPTRRPVREDLFVDEKDGTKRLKRCDEHYAKFVSELWFSAAYTIQSDQMRGLTEDVMAEGCARMYEIAMGNKIKVESKTGTNEKEKESLKRRLGKSPDLFDCLVIGVEGARQRGFKIKRLGASSQDDGNNGFQWLADRVRKHESFVRSKQLEYAQT